MPSLTNAPFSGIATSFVIRFHVRLGSVRRCRRRDDPPARRTS
jgi:hypothetical protein